MVKFNPWQINKADLQLALHAFQTKTRMLKLTTFGSPGLSMKRSAMRYKVATPDLQRRKRQKSILSSHPCESKAKLWATKTVIALESRVMDGARMDVGLQ